MVCNIPIEFQGHIMKVSLLPDDIPTCHGIVSEEESVLFGLSDSHARPVVGLGPVPPVEDGPKADREQDELQEHVKIPFKVPSLLIPHRQ
jgi:hypothetical protein